MGKWEGEGGEGKKTEDGSGRERAKTQRDNG